MKGLDILMITHNRPEYTRLALTRLIESCDKSMHVWIWHNGTHEATLEVVRDFSNDSRLVHLETSVENKKLREPTNWFWSRTTADYVSKVDDDCLLPDGWASSLIEAHEANAKLGVVGCWRFYPSDFDPVLAGRKIINLACGRQLMTNPWVQGSGYVMKRECIERIGPILSHESFTDYCVRVALGGYINGWLYPFIHEEHMDDPRSEYCRIKTNKDFLAARPLTAINEDVQSAEEWRRRAGYMAIKLQSCSPDPRQYVGWRRRMRNLWKRAKRMLRVREPWRVE